MEKSHLIWLGFMCNLHIFNAFYKSMSGAEAMTNGNKFGGSILIDLFMLPVNLFKYIIVLEGI